MDKTTVLVAGTGNTTGINVIKALMGECKIIGTDCNEINAANKFCMNYIVPRADNEQYKTTILDIIEREKITHIISTNDHDTRTLFMMHNILEDRKVIHNAYCNNAFSFLDKEKTTHLFQKNHIDTPNILNKPRIPFVLRKKEMGNRSKFLYIVRNEDDIKYIPNEVFLQGIMTEYVNGSEFTIDVLCDSESNTLCIIPRQRLEVRNGIVWHGKTVKDENLIELVKNICKKLHICGIMCLQCIKCTNEKFKFIEINPRVGSGIDLSIHSGCNIPLLWIKLTSKETFTMPELHWGTEMIRYNSAYFFHA